MLGQQVAGSMAFRTGHWHAGIIGQFTGVAVGTQAGHFSTGQQVVGSTPALTGSAPPGQAISSIGQATGGLGGVQLGGTGTHWPAQVSPEQLPAASQVQVGLLAGHEQAPPALPFAHPHPKQAWEQRKPAGQSPSDAQDDDAGWQLHGPPHGSAPAQTSSWPGLQAGSVHPQGAAEADPVAAAHGHW